MSWAKRIQGEIHTIWSQLANDMEEEVLTRYRVKKEARCKSRLLPREGPFGVSDERCGRIITLLRKVEMAWPEYGPQKPAPPFS